MQHFVILNQEQSIDNIANVDPADYPSFLAANWEVYIGNDPVWYKNPRCPVESQLSSDYQDIFSDSTLNRMVPAFGFKVECNMSGTFTFFVARSLPSDSVTICDAAVLGTTYVRDEPLVENIEVQAKSSTTLTVPHVHASDIIGNVLAIDLRLSEDSEFTSV